MPTTNSKPFDIRERTFEYAVEAIELYKVLERSRSGACWVIGKQFLRSATSIGANLEEAKAGESRSDFLHKSAIAAKEARESLYWLRLMGRMEALPHERINPMIEETSELVSILTAIVHNTKRKVRAGARTEH